MNPKLLVNIRAIVPVDKERRILNAENGNECLSIAILNDIIVGVGVKPECEELLKAAMLGMKAKDVATQMNGNGATDTATDEPDIEVIDCTDMLALPGLIDAHCHAGHALVKTLGGGDGKQWSQACHKIYTVGSTEAFWEAGKYIHRCCSL